ncbi:hypothetical protein ABMY35_20305 [Pseudoalteromonas sp. BZB3]|uniref:hypothetical protein n=1 Tax=Pseudoalteromonas sp. BZB3 TaxID=3136670 RepID=UPI0032C3FF1B|tara:strand:- start:2255 stop:2569 length:315 start_codon:yes stop_codon:yes gene_type:complete
MSKDMRIQLLYRVEPGCLGPDGIDYIEEFCQFAVKKIPPPNYAILSFVPRYDKLLDEKEYSLLNRKLTQGQVDSYFQKIEKPLEEFESQVDELIAFAVDAFFDR